MEVLQSIAALIVTLGLLVTFHEYGHFWVARRCGVKVLRFSVGFGKSLFTWYDKKGTEFVIAAIPLGGYVKMLDEREGPVPDDELDLTFNRKSVYQRIAIVAAGPIANFIFAIIAYWMVFVSGVTGLAPVIGDINEGSAAAKAGMIAGQEIIAVDGEPTNTWRDVRVQLFNRLGESGEITFSLGEFGASYGADHSILISDWLQEIEQPFPLNDLGIQPYRISIPPVIGELQPDGRALQAGLQKGDLVVSANGKTVDSWSQWVDVVRASPEKDLAVIIDRQGQELPITLRPLGKELESGEFGGFIGSGVQFPDPPPTWPENMRRQTQYGLVYAWVPALEETWKQTVFTLTSIKKLLIGLISVKNLSGPITIAKVAGQTASSGFETFLQFLAMLSIMLGVANLLPIPVLDGGHLLYYLMEVVKGRPVSEKTQLIGLKMGMFLLAGVMMLAIYNDLMRL